MTPALESTAAVSRPGFSRYAASVRFFNTAGPCDSRFHYMVPAAERLPEVPRIVAMGGYFVVHAPRQTGKTTSLRALARMLTAEGRYAAIHFSCEIAEATGEDYVAAQRAVISSIQRAAEDGLPAELQPPENFFERDPASLLTEALRAWTRACPRPLVLFFDEIDAIRGQSLISVLRQLRDIYPGRPDAAPWSVALCGLRDVRDYKAASGGDPGRLGSASPFNIKVESVRLGDFTRDEMLALYAQHSAETGQRFSDEALTCAFELTGGQPWLVNALAYEIVTRMAITEPITAADVETAKERLILARATHLDSLVDKLRQDRVRGVIQPMMAGTHEGHDDVYDDNFAYVRDLGLIAPEPPTRPANPIYREVMVRALSAGIERRIIHDSRPFVQDDGQLDMDSLLRAFGDFWRENGEVLTGSMTYHEVAPQLVLMAFLQRVVNGGGFIDREYGLGRYRMDLQVRWPYGDEGQWQREAIELKVWRDKKRDPLDDGLVQLGEYLTRLGLEQGFLVLFDRRSDAAELQERIAFDHGRTPEGYAVTVLRA